MSDTKRRPPDPPAYGELVHGLRELCGAFADQFSSEELALHHHPYLKARVLLNRVSGFLDFWAKDDPIALQTAMVKWGEAAIAKEEDQRRRADEEETNDDDEEL